MVVAEAINCNCPVLINNKVKGPKEILKNKKEFIFNSKEDFSKKLNLINENLIFLKDFKTNLNKN